MTKGQRMNAKLLNASSREAKATINSKPKFGRSGALNKPYKLRREVGVAVLIAAMHIWPNRRVPKDFPDELKEAHAVLWDLLDGDDSVRGIAR